MRRATPTWYGMRFVTTWLLPKLCHEGSRRHFKYDDPNRSLSQVSDDGSAWRKEYCRSGALRGPESHCSCLSTFIDLPLGGVPGTPLLPVSSLACFIQAIEDATGRHPLRHHQASYVKQALQQQLLNHESCRFVRSGGQIRQQNLAIGAGSPLSLSSVHCKSKLYRCRYVFILAKLTAA